ncbi:MAG TPA: thioesterase family protein [Spirochaetia bacterium]|nr:thioesterase family protein [Spirochaetia bacterium]
MNEIYKVHLKVRWGDLDSNAHMANTAYLNVAADVRLMYFEENGFSGRDFGKIHIGSVVMKDEIKYYKELRLLEDFEVHLLISGISEDGSRFRLHNSFYRQDGKKAASVTTTAGWLDLTVRKLIAPPRSLYEAMERLARTEDFATLPNSLK